MARFEDKAVLEGMLFEAIEYLEKQLQGSRRDPTLKIRYQSGLAALDLLNEEYRQITGTYYIAQDRVLKYHAKQWDVFS